jgi:hypothetical protein
LCNFPSFQRERIVSCKYLKREHYKQEMYIFCAAFVSHLPYRTDR